MLAILSALESGAQAKDVSGMKQHVSESYSDAQGNDKRGIAGIVAFHFLQNRSVYLLVRVRDVTIAESGKEAGAEVLVAMAGTPIPGPEALPALRADVHRFDFLLREEDGGEWRIVRAEWRPASLEDFR